MSLICDGSTDNNNTEDELTYVGYGHQRSINVHFVGVKNIAKGDAQVIEVAMSTLFTDYFAGPSWEKKIVGTGTDGSSTMLVKNSGFVTKLRQRLDRPELVAVHCSAHRNELAYNDAARGIQLYKKVDALLLSLYFYRNSPLNRSILKQAFDALGETHRIPSRVGGKLCVPHISRAVSNVLKGYKGLVTHLSQVMNPDVPGRTTEERANTHNYYALLYSKDVVYFLHFLADVTAALSDVSEAFQQNEITIADINSVITACKEVIEKYGKKDGRSVKMINGKDQFLGEKIGAPSSAFEEARRGMVQGLLSQ